MKFLLILKKWLLVLKVNLVHLAKSHLRKFIITLLVPKKYDAFWRGVKEISSKDIKSKDGAIRSSLKGKIKDKLDKALNSVCPESLCPICFIVRMLIPEAFIIKHVKGRYVNFLR